ncbi:hypothetical protein SUGI_0600240 [Cryptomeria japonica]|nr:hypothetical protein SUGI_0600240 [Cryptomeria japonica]
MAIQLISKPPRLIQLPLTTHQHLETLPSSRSAINTRKFAIFCAGPLETPDKSLVTQLLVNKYEFTERSIRRALRHCPKMLHSTSTQNLEQVLELLESYGLTPLQIRRVVVCNPRLFELNPKKNIKPKLSFLKTIVKEKDIPKLISLNPRLFNLSLEPRLKNAVSFLQKCGFEGEELSFMVATVPKLLTVSEANAVRLFNQVEAFGHKKGSPMFAVSLRSLMGISNDYLEKKLCFLYRLGFSKEQVLVLCRRKPQILEFSRGKMKRNVEFLVNYAGLPLSEIVKYPHLLAYSLEARIIPRQRVFEALKSMGAIKRTKSFPQIVMLNEERFMEKQEYLMSMVENDYQLQHAAADDHVIRTRHKYGINLMIVLRKLR